MICLPILLIIPPTIKPIEVKGKLGVIVDKFKRVSITIDPDNIGRGNVAVNIVTILITEADIIPISIPERFSEAIIIFSLAL